MQKQTFPTRSALFLSIIFLWRSAVRPCCPNAFRLRESYDGTHNVDTKYLVCPLKCKKCFTPPGTYGTCPSGYYKSSNCCIPREIGGGGQEGDSFRDITVLTENNLSDEETSNSVDLCCLPSPIVIDILGNGYNLTDSASGVMFDFNGDGVPHRISWTAADSDDAWLVLDRSGNSLIHSSKEMFGTLIFKIGQSEVDKILDKDLFLLVYSTLAIHF